MRKQNTTVDPRLLTAIAAALQAAYQDGNRRNQRAQSAPKVRRDTSPEGKAQRVADYEASVIKGLNAKGIKTADIQLRQNVLPYKVWLEKGRVVRKGQHGVRGLFHISQTDELPAQPVAPVGDSPKVEATSEVAAG